MKVIASYSIKGGVGKTVSSVNIAYAAAEAGHRTLLVDLDPQGASSFYFRVKPSKKFKAKRFFSSSRQFEMHIRGSDYGRLDILPANINYRNFDSLLGGMQKSHMRLKKTLKHISHQYDVVVLDCPPTIGILSENVFVAADIIVVPVIPTTLSERTFEQLLKFFRNSNYPVRNIRAFFSMVQTNNRLHKETVLRMRGKYKQFLSTIVPMSADVERMGVRREPVICYAPSRAGSRAYRRLCAELLQDMGLS